MNEASRVSVDEFFAKHAVVPFEATVEAGTGGKVKVTPWSADGGCQCEAALELPKSVIESLTLTGKIHRCCGKGLQVVSVVFADTHRDVLNAAFGALAARALPRPPTKACESFCNSGIDCRGVSALCAATGNEWACEQRIKCLQCHCSMSGL